MELSREEKQEYRRKRNGTGWLIAAGWILFWCFRSSDGSWTGSANYYGMVFVAIITAPFAFLVSHYIARAQVESVAQQRALQQEATAAAGRRKEEAERAERARRIDDEARVTRDQLDRGEVIRKLGSVRDYLTLLPGTTDPDRMALIQQSIDKEMRDLAVKHDPAALTALIARDEPVKLSLAAIVQTLEQHGPLSPDAEVLKRALLPRPSFTITAG